MADQVLETAQPIKDEITDATRVLRYLQTPVEVSIDLTLRGDSATGALAGKPAVAAPASDPGAPPGPIERLRSLGPQVMHWLAASDANRLLFLGDPVAALQKMDATIDKGFLKDLQRARNSVVQPAVDPRIRLARIQVTATATPVAVKPPGK